MILLVVFVLHNQVVSEDSGVFNHSIWIEWVSLIRLEALLDGILLRHDAVPRTSQDATNMLFLDALFRV